MTASPAVSMMRRAMSFFRRLLTVIGLVSLFVGGVSAETTPAERRSRPTTSTLIDLNGQPADVFQQPDIQLLVFIFVRTDCPVSNAYAPEVGRLVEHFSPRKVAFWLVYTDPDESPAHIRKHVSAYAYPCEALCDPSHLFARRSQVRITPEAAVYTHGGDLLYHGRIDNRYVTFGKARPQATESDLKNALESALAGKPVPKPSGTAVGCFIEGIP